MSIIEKHSPDQVRQLIADAMRMEKVLRGIRHDSTFRGVVYDATGIPERTLKNYDTAAGLPGAIQLLTLMEFFGARFTNEFLRAAGQGHAIDLDIVEEAPDAFKMQAGIAKTMNELATALADAIFDHSEMAKLGPRCRDLGADLIAFAAQCESKVRGGRNS